MIQTVLPVDGVVKVVADGPGVDDGDDEQVQSHAEVGDGQVTHEELGYSHAEATAAEHQQDRGVAEYGRDGDQPDGDPQRPVAHQVLAGVEGVGAGLAVHVSVVLGQVAAERLDPPARLYRHSCTEDAADKNALPGCVFQGEHEVRD